MKRDIRKEKLHEFVLYRLCCEVVNSNIGSLSGVSSFDAMYCLKKVAEAIDIVRTYPSMAKQCMLAFGGKLYQTLYRDNERADDAQLRRCTLVIGNILAIVLTCKQDSHIMPWITSLSKGLQDYGDVMSVTHRMLDEIDDVLIDDVVTWVIEFWESNDSLLDDEGELIIPGIANIDFDSYPTKMLTFISGKTKTERITILKEMIADLEDEVAKVKRKGMKTDNSTLLSVISDYYDNRKIIEMFSADVYKTFFAPVINLTAKGSYYKFVKMVENKYPRLKKSK